MRVAACILALCVGTQAAALPEMVTDLAMCGLDPIDSQEMGMRLGVSEMWEIEYYCEFPALDIDWSGDLVETRVGYCSEPGVLTPEIWVFQASHYEPGIVNVWWQGGDEPTRFVACP